MKCYICPRECGADRDNGEVGACHVDSKIRVAHTMLHMWEEPCISSKEGSGAVFFSGCPLSCIYCQNYEISRNDKITCKNNSITELKDKTEGINNTGYFTINELSDEFLRLQNLGANNINLVTPTHYSMQIIDAVKIAKNSGLKIPVVYNCSGYEKIETIKMLKEIVDIYLTDFKYMEEDLAKRFSKAPKYPEIAKSALTEMVNQQPNLVFDNRGILQSGVIVRNLLLPGHVKNSKEICKYVYEKYGDKVILSIMNQYTPTQNVMNLEKDKELSRKVTKREYERLIDYVLGLGIKNAYIQEGDVASESFIPSWHP